MNENFSVIQGAEELYFEGNDIGVLISHGFMGTPQSVEYLGDRLAQFGYTVMAPRLKGHGTHHFDLENCNHEDWFASLEEGYKKLQQKCSTIFVIGQSMGGALALRLVNKYPSINGVIVVNAALSLPAYEVFKGVTEPRFIDEGEPDIKDQTVHEITYSKVPLHAIHELQKIMENTPAIIPSIQTPILAIKSLEDHVVPSENTDYILKTVGSKVKKMITLTNSYHVASMDYDKEEIVEQTNRFISNQLLVNYSKRKYSESNNLNTKCF
ncbi:alpha/beta hydrolase [Bacillus massiliigorillae]|uniref:alpha/beta hydrolase n=1 Tax=Bacillus massiliigorillae TaxID=1243664 RepID=UPI00039CF1C4|nr:alpha/beta fold hydrolase [Bacillus massiliigorillae]